MNRMTKKRVGMVLAFSLTLTGAAAYIGIQQGNTDKTEAAGSLTAGVSASLNASEVEALDVTAGVTSQLYDKTDVAVAANEKQMVAQGIQRAHFETSHLRRQKKRFRKIPRRIPASVGIKILESRRCREA